ncbi:MAG: pyridoxamine 5'-phosphate oxidase family protein [Nitrospirae bacterium]|nr:pyridoxamine 5'-phosphate oxidase family protein [Nitrospirota bacterium]
MANEEIKQMISAYLKTHNKLTLATVTPEGNPLAHTVEYVSDGGTIYFGTSKETRKAQNIMKNPSVAYAVDEDYTDWTKIQGVQMSGKASILTDQGELEKVMKLYVAKFPAVADFPPDMDMVMIKIVPVSGYFLDYTMEFAHRDEVKF